MRPRRRSRTPLYTRLGRVCECAGWSARPGATRRSGGAIKPRRYRSAERPRFPGGSRQPVGHCSRTGHRSRPLWSRQLRSRRVTDSATGPVSLARPRAPLRLPSSAVPRAPEALEPLPASTARRTAADGPARACRPRPRPETPLCRPEMLPPRDAALPPRDAAAPAPAPVTRNHRRLCCSDLCRQLAVRGRHRSHAQIGRHAGGWCGGRGMCLGRVGEV